MTAPLLPPINPNSSFEQFCDAVCNNRGKEVWQLLHANNSALLELNALDNPSFLENLIAFELVAWCELLPPSELTAWGVDCAERVLPSIEAICPGDERPRSLLCAARTGTHDQALASATADLVEQLGRRLLAEKGAGLKETLTRGRRAALAAFYAAASASPEDKHTVQIVIKAIGLASLATSHPDQERTWQLSRLVLYLRRNLL